MLKKSITYKEASQSTEGALVIILMTKTGKLAFLSPSNRKSDVFGRDLNMNRCQDMDAAPRRRKFLNCRRTEFRNREKKEKLFQKRAIKLWNTKWRQRRGMGRKRNKKKIRIKSKKFYISKSSSTRPIQIKNQKEYWTSQTLGNWVSIL